MFKIKFYLFALSTQNVVIKMECTINVYFEERVVGKVRLKGASGNYVSCPPTRMRSKQFIGQFFLLGDYYCLYDRVVKH